MKLTLLTLQQIHGTQTYLLSNPAYSRDALLEMKAKNLTTKVSSEKEEKSQEGDREEQEGKIYY